MVVTIWDTDWCYNKESFPNIYCMKLSSYHQQLGDTINFVRDEVDTTLACDKRYIFRENEDTPLPPRRLLDENKTILLGKGFKYYDVKQVSMVVAACRPDYLLYGLKKGSIFENSNFLLFYHNGKRIPLSQDYHNTLKGRKKNLVIDKGFWKADCRDIEECLNVLAQEKNIAFLEPISLKVLLSNENICRKFLSLNFTTGSKFKWKNDYGNEPDQIAAIVDFMKALSAHTHSAIGKIPIKIVQCNEFQVEDGWKIDFLKALQSVHYCRERGLNCELKYKITDLAAYPWASQNLAKWTMAKQNMSFVEFIIAPYCLVKGINWYDILNNSLKWSCRDIDNLVGLLADEVFAANIDLFFYADKNNTLNKNLVNWEVPKAKASLITRGDNN